MSSGLARNSPLGLCAHLKRAAEEIEVVDVDRAEIHLQRLKDIRQRHVEHVGLHAIDVGKELRRGGAIGCKHAGQRGIASRSGHEIVGRLLQSAARRARRGPGRRT